jgi:hypothetical protein
VLFDIVVLGVMWAIRKSKNRVDGIEFEGENRETRLGLEKYLELELVTRREESLARG